VPPVIKIFNHSSLNADELLRVEKTISNLFSLDVIVEKSPLQMRDAFDSSRQQYNSTALLAQILQQSNPENYKIIAVVDADLCIPILTFVFGEAQLDGTAAIVSTHRLSNQFYGLESNRFTLLSRLEKEIVHELGHTFGLLHCRQFECVMRSSTYVEEIDLKRIDFCPACRVALNPKIGFSSPKEI
jgi:archaemetzincin